MMDAKQMEKKLTLLDQLQSVCTHCGLCSEGCATFQLAGWEQESPRGRLHLAAQFLHGKIPLASPALKTFDRCLGCRACESLCPHQVSYHRVRHLVQELRQEFASGILSPMNRQQYSKWITLAYRIGNTFWRRYGSKWISIPSLSFRSIGSYMKQTKRPLKGQAILAVCCVQDLFQHEVIEVALSFMKRLGYPLKVDKSQPCCGALFERLIHGGLESIVHKHEQKKARFLQNNTLKSFIKWLPTSTYFLSKGCHSFVTRNNEQSGDLYGLIESILIEQQLALYFPEQKEIFYQPYCSSTREWNDPIWRLLHRIDGLTVKKMPSSNTCCGGYCGETFLHPENAKDLVEKKLIDIPEKATLIVTSPDCWGLFRNYRTEDQLILLYPIQLLAEAYIRPVNSF